MFRKCLARAGVRNGKRARNARTWASSAASAKSMPIEVRRGSIGPLGIEKLTPQLADEIGVKGTSGALVSRRSWAMTLV